MLKKKYEIARSLCAVILATCVLIGIVSFPSSSEAEGTLTEDDYQYAVTIEFGAMSFYYDYGTWDVNELRYVTDKSSVFPSAETDDGFPGWYGFDGVTNRISVTYVNSYDDYKDQAIAISLTYRALTEDEISGVGGSQIVDGVAMSFYEDSDFLVALPSSFIVQNNVKKELYVSLSGEPQRAGGRYESGSFSPVGMLTIQIGDFSDEYDREA